MISSNRIIRKGERPLEGQRTNPYAFLRLGRITHVDNETNIVSITWLDSVGGSAQVPITSPMATKRSFMGGMPERNALVICGFTKQTQTSGRAQILTYLTDGYRDSLRFFLDRGNYDDRQNKVVEGDPTNELIDEYITSTVGHENTRSKRRKLYAGELEIQSADGSEINISEDLQLMNSNLNEITLRSADQNIIHNALNHTIISGGAKIINGLVTRNLKNDYTSIKQTDNMADESLVPFQTYITLGNGKRLFVVTADNLDFDNTDTTLTNQNGGGAFTELRTEVRELASGELNVTEEIAETDLDDFSTKPFITHVMGTLVGNDPTNRSQYGQVLRPRIFRSADATKADVGNDAVGNELYLRRTLATAYELSFNNYGEISHEFPNVRFQNQTKIAIDKQGHAFINLSASTTDHPLGAGRSLEFNSDGSIKMVVGMNTTKNESIDLYTMGGVSQKFGQNIDKHSLDLETDGAVYITVKGTDEDGFGMVTNVTGNVTETIAGNKTLDINGTYTIIANGTIDERIRGTKIESYINDKYITYGGDLIETIINKIESNVGSSHIVNISGDPLNSEAIANKINIVSGASEETILIGDKRLSITTGDYEENLTAGDKKVSISVGNYEVNVTSGDITVQTSLGSVTISGSSDVTVTGLNITNEASTTNTVKAGALVLIDGPVINFGEGATQPIVKGFELLSWLASHTHIHPMGPTGPAIIPPSAGILSTQSFVK